MCIPYTKGMVSCETPKACAVMDNESVSVYVGVSSVVEHTTLACLQGRQKCTCAALPANVLCVQHNQKLCGLSSFLLRYHHPARQGLEEALLLHTHPVPHYCAFQKEHFPLFPGSAKPLRA